MARNNKWGHAALCTGRVPVSQHTRRVNGRTINVKASRKGRKVSSLPKLPRQKKAPGDKAPKLGSLGSGRVRSYRASRSNAAAGQGLAMIIMAVITLIGMLVTAIFSAPSKKVAPVEQIELVAEIEHAEVAHEIVPVEAIDLMDGDVLPPDSRVDEMDDLRAELDGVIGDLKVLKLEAHSCAANWGVDFNALCPEDMDDDVKAIIHDWSGRVVEVTTRGQALFDRLDRFGAYPGMPSHEAIKAQNAGWHKTATALHAATA